MSVDSPIAVTTNGATGDVDVVAVSSAVDWLPPMSSNA